MLGLSIGFNAVSTHGTCTAVFVAVAAILAWMCASIQTLGRITWLAWVGVVSILSASKFFHSHVRARSDSFKVLILTIAVGVQSRPAAAPQTGVWVSDFKITNNPSFTEAISAISSLIFAYAGTPGFFAIVSEMRDPRRYNRSLWACQAVVTITYITIGVVVYYYCGSYVASPALGSAGTTMKKICYGLALPGLLVSTTILTHVSAFRRVLRRVLTTLQFPAKYIFVRILKGSQHLTNNSMIHWVTWLGCTFGCAMIAYIIASAVPVFGGLVSLVGALFGTLLSFQPMACMWLYDNWSREKRVRDTRWTLMVCWSVFVIVSGTFCMIAGTYGSIVGIIDSYNTEGGSSAWSCADNSNSV